MMEAVLVPMVNVDQNQVYKCTDIALLSACKEEWFFPGNISSFHSKMDYDKICVINDINDKGR